MKIILIGQPSEEKFSNICPPIGLCYLSAYLKKEEFDAELIDCSSYSFRKIRKILREKKPDIIGIQCLTIERSQTYKIAKMIRKVLPDSIIIVGGQHATAYPEQMFKLMPIDFVIMGEGEETISELIFSISTDKSYNDIKGIAYQENGKIIVNEKRPLIENLDNIPFPDYSNINFDDYRFGNFKNVSIPIMSSRGCPFMCNFCGSSIFWEGKFRARSAKNVIEEIQKYYDMGYTNFNFYDDNFIIDKNRLIKICQMIIDKNINIKFMIAANISLIDNEKLTWLKKAGCVSIGFGVESGSDKILKNIGKPQTRKAIIEAFNLCKHYDIEAGGSLIVGNPGETKETIKETAQLMNLIAPDYLSYAGIMWVLPKTKIYELSGLSDDIWLKNHKDIFFTKEYSLRYLKFLQIYLLWQQAKNRDLKQKMHFIKWLIYLNLPRYIKRVFRMIYYKIIRLK